MSAADASTPRRRWRVRFSLRTLLLVTACIGSSGALWIKWEPWRTTASARVDDLEWFRLSPDGHKVAVVAPSGVYLVDLEHSAKVERVQCTHQTETIVWSQDSTRFMTSVTPFLPSPPGPFETTLWTIAPLKPVLTSQHVAKTETDYLYTLSTDGKRLFSNVSSPDATRCTDADTGALLWENTLSGPGAVVEPTGRFLFAGRHLLDAGSGNIVWSALPFGPVSNLCAVFSVDGRWLAVARSDEIFHELHVYDLQTARETYTEKDWPGACWSLRFSPDGKRFGMLIFQHGATTVDFRRSEDGMRVQQLPCATGKPFDFCDDTHVVCDCELRDLATTRVLTKYRSQPSFSPDKRRALVCRWADTYTICDAWTGGELFDLSHCDNVEWMDADHIFCQSGGALSVVTRVRPEGLVGLLALPELWATLLGLVGLLLSVRADRRSTAQR